MTSLALPETNMMNTTTSLALSESHQMNIKTLALVKRQKTDVQFRRRRISLFRKAYLLGKLCDADICVVIHRNNDYFIYKSKDDPLWPPSFQDMVSFYI